MLVETQNFSNFIEKSFRQMDIFAPDKDPPDNTLRYFIRCVKTRLNGCFKNLKIIQDYHIEDALIAHFKSDLSYDFDTLVDDYEQKLQDLSPHFDDW